LILTLPRQSRDTDVTFTGQANYAVMSHAIVTGVTAIIGLVCLAITRRLKLKIPQL
jgi:hypothetical protein